MIAHNTVDSLLDTQILLTSHTRLSFLKLKLIVMSTRNLDLETKNKTIRLLNSTF